MATDYQYMYEAGTLTTDTVFDVADSLGLENVKGGFIINDSLTANLGIAFSIGGTNYGDTIILYPSEQLKVDIFVKFKKVKLVHQGTNVPYRMLICMSALAVDAQ